MLFVLFSMRLGGFCANLSAVYFIISGRRWPEIFWASIEALWAGDKFVPRFI